MRKTALDVVYELANKNKNVIFIGSDLSPGVLKELKKEMPEKFLMEGISEQHIIGMAAGMAMDGFVPYVNTISTFITRRCYEQIVIDVCLHNLPVRLIGNGGGLVYAPLGPTHQSIEDLSIMRSIPNMTVIAPADDLEMRALMSQSYNYRGPIYIRVAKGNEPRIYPKNQKFKIGKAINFKIGKDILLITTGITLHLAKEVDEHFKNTNINIGIMHFNTVKPFDKKTLFKELKKYKIVLTIEEHSILGGLGGICSELLLESNYHNKLKFKRIGLRDIFTEGYGSQKELMNKYNISLKYIVKQILKLKKK